MQSLIDILSIRREHDSDGELLFVTEYLMPMKPTPMYDDKGNVVAYVVDNSKGKSTIMWSCHIDTMHKNNTKNPDQLYQEVWVDEQGIAFVTDKEDCLGADDGAGIWLMLEMIKADVAGTYVFHRGEEKGCWGSSRMALHHKEWLANFTHAIAFDRRANHSVITHQSGARACSDLLGNRLCQLFGMDHELDPTGVYTDTAEYVEIIPECVNVSSGYNSEHSHRETLDTKYILSLRDAICAVDWLTADLPVDRDPTVYEGRQYSNGWGYNTGSAWDYDYYMGRDKYDGMGDLLDHKEIPDVASLRHATITDIKNWVRKTDTELIAYLIEDLVYELESAYYDMRADNDGDYDEYKGV
jgi:hypothetical protein